MPQDRSGPVINPLFPKNFAIASDMLPHARRFPWKTSLAPGKCGWSGARGPLRNRAETDGKTWQLANDPQPGASGTRGSFMPPLGDLLVARFDVPVGFIACGVGATRRLYRDGGTCLLRDDAPVPESDPYFRQHLTDIIGTESIRLVEQFHREQKPFFLNIWHLVPHMPYEPGSEPHYRNTVADGLTEDQHCFRSMVAHLDAVIGALLAKLEALGIRDNTLIVFTSDNGGAYEADVGPLKGGKTDPHEGGIRVPMIVSWRGKIPAGKTSTALAGSVDLLPTLLIGNWIFRGIGSGRGLAAVGSIP
ncbi:MAG: hypothetical protein EXS37_09775 [Opitutus sp.]|nr:hypothetical protein [Opitutus sp.]